MFNQKNVAFVITDPQVEFLKSTGKGFGATKDVLEKVNTIENLTKLFALAKERGYKRFISPHYFYPHDHKWQFKAAGETMMIENGFVEAIKAEFPEVEVIAGTATAGIPHGAIIADKMNLPFAYIRSKPKDHGAGNQIEGRVAQGQKMVVVEDLISTGGSVLEAVAAAKREGADVLGVVAIFSYQLPKADKNFADADVKLVTLSNYSELIHLAQEEGYITPEGLDLLKRFKEDQENWQNA